jgi:hypothetical protein
MDPHAFDRLTRLLVSTSHRRGVLGLVAGVLAGLGGRGYAARETGAQERTCRRLGTVCLPERGLDCCHGTCQDGRCRCRPNQRACRGQCIPQGQCCHSGDCPPGKVCRKGRCRCRAGTKRCGDRCIATDACCGGCPPGQSCRGGRCEAGCPALPACTDGCACPSGQTCLGGSCCPTEDVCGSVCGCPTGQICLSNGSCAITCNAQTQPCSACAQGASLCSPEVSGALVCWALDVPDGGNCANTTTDCAPGYFCYFAAGNCFPLCT